MLLATGHQDGLEAPAHGVNMGPQSPELRLANASKASRDGVFFHASTACFCPKLHTHYTHTAQTSVCPEHTETGKLNRAWIFFGFRAGGVCVFVCVNDPLKPLFFTP